MKNNLTNKSSLAFIILIACLFFTVEVMADPPTPPAGYKWVLIEELTDEFNDGIVDTIKWHNNNPHWKGRAPGLFKKSQVSEKDGLLVLRNKMVRDTSARHWIHTGFLASKSNSIFTIGMYSECRMKTASDGTVAGFWMKAAGRSKDEIDVMEGIGWSPKGNQEITKKMRMNVHTKTNQVNPTDYILPGGVGDRFYIYGVWRKDKRNIIMYSENKKVANFVPQEDMTIEMQLNINTECQTWLGAPNPEYVKDNTKNATYVDYVRTWKLVADNSGE